MTDEVMFDVPTYRRLQRAYAKAVRENKDLFEFDGRGWVTGYAKYVLEYLEDKLKERQR
jgi:hypothetical protein